MTPDSAMARLVHCSPREQSQAKGLPGQIGRKYKKPGGSIAGPNFFAQAAEEISVTVAAEFPEYILANHVNRDWYQNKSEK